MGISEASVMNSKRVCSVMLFVVMLGVSIPADAARPTTLVFTTNPAIGPYGGSISLPARLPTSGRPLSNRTIFFALNGVAVGSATTNSNGVATLNNVSLAGINASTYANAITASFAGGNNLNAAQAFATLTVNRLAASVTPNAGSKTYGAA